MPAAAWARKKVVLPRQPGLLSGSTPKGWEAGSKGRSFLPLCSADEIQGGEKPLCSFQLSEHCVCVCVCFQVSYTTCFFTNTYFFKPNECQDRMGKTKLGWVYQRLFFGERGASL